MKHLLFVCTLVLVLALTARAQYLQPAAKRFSRQGDYVKVSSATGTSPETYDARNVSIMAFKGTSIRVMINNASDYYSPAMFLDQNGQPYGMTAQAAVDAWAQTSPVFSGTGVAGVSSINGKSGTVTGIVETTGSYTDPSFILNLNAAKITETTTRRFISDSKINQYDGYATSKMAYTDSSLFVRKLAGTRLMTTAEGAKLGNLPASAVDLTTYNTNRTADQQLIAGKQNALGYVPLPVDSLKTVNFSGPGVVSTLSGGVWNLYFPSASVTVDGAINPASSNPIANSVVAGAITGLNSTVAANSATLGSVLATTVMPVVSNLTVSDQTATSLTLLWTVTPTAVGSTGGGTGLSVTVDNALSSSSTNPIANAPVTNALGSVNAQVSANSSAITANSTAITNNTSAIATNTTAIGQLVGATLTPIVTSLTVSDQTSSSLTLNWNSTQKGVTTGDLLGYIAYVQVGTYAEAVALATGPTPKRIRVKSDANRGGAASTYDYWPDSTDTDKLEAASF